MLELHRSKYVLPQKYIFCSAEPSFRQLIYWRISVNFTVMASLYYM